MITLYRHPLSGHSHRVQLFLSLLGLEHRLVDVDLSSGAHKREDFLRKNRFGQVPVLDDDGTLLADSNAILVYLALTYAPASWYPRAPEAAAQVQRWLSVAAGEIANGPGSARLVTVFGAALDAERAQRTAASLLETLESHLGTRAWLAGGTPTIADVAGYAYIAHAPEGGVSLDSYPAVRAWLGRIEGLPGFVPMQATAAGLAA